MPFLKKEKGENLIVYLTRVAYHARDKERSSRNVTQNPIVRCRIYNQIFDWSHRTNTQTLPRTDRELK